MAIVNTEGKVVVEAPATLPDGHAEHPHAQPPTRWHPATRIAFRFCFAYFGLYLVTTPMFQSAFKIPVVPLLSQAPPVQAVVSWVATDLLGFAAPLVLMSGSGDKPYDWAHALVVLVLAAVLTAAWSVLDRRRAEYTMLHAWFRLALRLSLGAVLVLYGAAKLLPLQMPFPDLTRLLQPFGQFSPMGVLWSSMGAAPAYQSFTGALEVFAGILLFVPRQALLGALAALGVATQIFVLNMTYDVPVKLFSFHLTLIALVLLAPDLRRLANVLVLDRAVGPPERTPLLRNRTGRRALLVGQLALGLWVVGMNLNSSLQIWRENPVFLETRAGSPEEPFYGIWNVETMSIDGEVRPPLLTDDDRWRRLIFQGPNFAAIQHMNDTFSRVPASVDPEAATIMLAPLGSERDADPGRFSFERPATDRLILDGEMNGRTIRMDLRLVDRESFLLVQGRFRWVQDSPFNR